MNKIALKLIEYGMDFQYEHNGSQGEKIQSFKLGVEVNIQNGTIYFEYEGQQEMFAESETTIDHVVSLVDSACIEETT